MEMETSFREAFMVLIILSSAFFPLIELSIFTKRTERKNEFEHEMDFRIVGGEEASIKEFPFIVSIQVESNHICGGSILTNKYILTAAHCVILKYSNNTWSINDPLYYNIVAGQTVLDLGECQYRDVKKIYVHSGYTIDVNKNDIAVIEIFNPLEWTSYTKNVNISSRTDKLFEFHDVCTVLGWGTRVAYEKPPEEEKLIENNSLQQVDLQPSSFNKCEEYFTSNEAPYLYDETKLCVILTEEKAPCTGDSGGPFICNGIQYGIVSFGIGCAQLNMPAIFTNVSAFNDWINFILNDKEESVISRRVKVTNRFRSLSPETKMEQARSINGQLYLKCSYSFIDFMILFGLVSLLENMYINREDIL